MVPKNKILKILDEYDKKKLTVATLCSHSSLQIFNGAKKEGFRTLGLTVKDNFRYYDAFPLGRPDEFMKLDSYADLSAYGADVEGVTEFFPDRGPKVSISERIAADAVRRAAAQQARRVRLERRDLQREGAVRLSPFGVHVLTSRGAVSGPQAARIRKKEPGSDRWDVASYTPERRARQRTRD